jgi:hypothetical protein
MIDDAVADVRTRLGVTYGLTVDIYELCDAELMVIAGEIDAAHFDQGIGELREALARLRTLAGVAAGLRAAQRPVAARLLAQAPESSAIADRLVYLVRLGLPLDYLYLRGEAREVLEARAEPLAELLARVLAPERRLVACIGPLDRTASCDTLRKP